MKKIFEIFKQNFNEEDIYNVLEVAVNDYPRDKYSIELFVSDTALRVTVYER